jgi:hypothetical protein
MSRKRIGELLVEQGAITPVQLEEGLAHQAQSGQRLGVALIQKGFITEEQLAAVLSAALEIPLVSLSALTPDWAAVHMLRARFCEQHELFPYALTSVAGRKQLVVAMSDPLNAAAIEEIEFTTGLKVQPQLAPVSQVRAAILRYHHKVAPAQPEAPQPAPSVPSVPSPRRPTRPEVKADSDDEVIEGELLDEPSRKDVAARAELEELVRERERAAFGKSNGDLSTDLDYLFGVRKEPDQLEQLERKFWALMRIMARKGLISKDEFAEALGEDES